VTNAKYAYFEHVWIILVGKDNKAMQQPGFQCLIQKMRGEKYGKTFAANISKPLSLPPEKSGP